MGFCISMNNPCTSSLRRQNLTGQKHFKSIIQVSLKKFNSRENSFRNVHECDNNLTSLNLSVLMSQSYCDALLLMLF